MNNRQFSLDFPHAYGIPAASALFRQQLEDFQVTEQLGFVPSGEGEHLYLWVEKRGQNTRWVAGQLADAFSVDEVAVGYCGLKDRQAITRQWFSVHLPGAGLPPISELPVIPGVSVLSVSRHPKKLRRGMHSGNGFVICLRQIDAGSQQMIEERLAAIAQGGVPNYFGEQRFGRDGGNLPAAEQLFIERETRNRDRRSGRSRRPAEQGGIYLSAARSYLFNLVLAERVRQGSWYIALDGETEPSGPLWGRGRSRAQGEVLTLEEQVLANWQDWCHGLEFSGLSQERRSLVMKPDNFSWCWGDGGDEHPDLSLSFSLPPGCFATALLREVAKLQTARAVAD
ncbi:MAG: tRNA pseudouridine(13) synthase TruD [Porticoccaceae bacterium]